MSVEIATTDSFRDALLLKPVDALPGTDFTAKQLVTNLPADQEVFYRVTFSDLHDANASSEPLVGRFCTAPRRSRSVKFVWSGDTAGQGWGIDPAHGGMQTFATMARHRPDFFLHSGDAVYCDSPIPEEQAITGGIWRNIVAEGVHKVAETLDEFRGRWRYNLLDPQVRKFHAAVPVFYQWDDHEVLNNWSPAKDLSRDDRYTEKSIALLSARGRRAFHEMTPTRTLPGEPGRIYRRASYGPLLDLFFVDLRSYRGPNSTNLQREAGPGSQIFGERQMHWLRRELAASRATWKVIASSKSAGYVDWDDGTARTHDGIANSEGGPPRGRELELAGLLRFIRDEGVGNVVWLTADIHYAAAHYYDPGEASFPDFHPFWEFVAGPLHAGSFGPGALDGTFGGKVVFAKAPGPLGQNLPPSAGLQSFGVVEIDPETEVMTVRLMDRDDTELFQQELEPARSPRPQSASSSSSRSVL